MTYPAAHEVGIGVDIQDTILVIGELYPEHY